MFLFSIAIRKHVEFVGIDIGSQFLKFAESSINGKAKMMRLSSEPVNLPAAVAMRSKNQSVFPPKTADDFRQIEFKYGSSALPILNRNPSSGFQYLPRTFGLNYSAIPEFMTSNLSDPETLFTVFFMDFVQNLDFSENGGLVVALPFFWTPNQRHVVLRTCNIFKLPLISQVDDISAVSQLYSIYHSATFKNETREVLFIDFGATTLESYSIHFFYNSSTTKNTPDSIFARNTASKWSEKCGL